MLILVPSPTTHHLVSPKFSVERRYARTAPEGLYVQFKAGGQGFAALCLGGCVPDGPTGIVVLPDDYVRDRIDTLLRFHNALRHRRPLSDERLTPLRRRNLRQMLQAVDARLAGATYPEIGEVIFGAERVSAIAWKSMALRDTTMHRVRDGRTLVAGGYRTLLYRHRVC